MKKPILILLPVLALLIFALFNLGAKDKANKPKLVASFTTLSSIISEVAGSKFNVVSLIPAGVEPHDYEPLPAQQQDINDAVLIFQIGMDFDNWIADSINSPEKLIDLSKAIETRPNDPHYWLSYENASLIAAESAKEIKALFPEYSSEIDSNLLTYQLKLDNALESARSRITELPNKKIITQHDAYQYLANELNLEILGTIEEGHDSEPSGQHLMQLSDLVKLYGIKHIFAEPNTQSDLVITFAQDNNLEVIYFDAAGISTTDYLEMMDKNIVNLVSALK
jgi:ABC-type Zn uptake system ZnuABC Zn-binding protein ZnuA